MLLSNLRSVISNGLNHDLHLSETNIAFNLNLRENVEEMLKN